MLEILNKSNHSENFRIQFQKECEKLIRTVLIRAGKADKFKLCTNVDLLLSQFDEFLTWASLDDHRMEQQIYYWFLHLSDYRSKKRPVSIFARNVSIGMRVLVYNLSEKIVSYQATSYVSLRQTKEVIREICKTIVNKLMEERILIPVES